MSDRMQTRDIDNEDEYIDTARGSEQFEALLDGVDNDVSELEERQSSALGLYDSEAGENGVRVDFVYDGVQSSDSENVSLNIQCYYPEEGTPEAIGYLREGNSLLKEFYTNEEIVPELRVDEPDGSVILEPREYDDKDLLT